MIEQDIQIQMRHGTADAVLFRPEGQGPWPGVLHLPDIGGIRPAHSDMARRLAGEGYVVLMPNILYRTARIPVFDKKPEIGSDEFRKRFAELTGPLTPEAIERDALVYVDRLSSDPSVKPDSKIGVVGYCFSGAIAMRVAAARPDKVGAVASFHGGGLYTDAPTSPHLVLPRIKAEMYFGHASKDRSMPEEAIQKFESALRDSGGKFESETYDGAYHSWTASDSPVYNPGQAERAFRKLRELFARAL